ncbi:metallophosphoesterase family protein [Ferrimicrobium acidiphilum]|uniref:Nuclease SbcCD subunit D n=1 Tax=Ferrimicrobium acidiphilum DSM 19497 TaxID=1121877 RepID=A0A0D8FTP4_9ACTN|nr:DNA repair exonuclease [Ferrimicrobium acidiphilum]KJE75627.1 exonuclease subunit SbcD [Ferrimicrobium acidiphilum DSM 19497]
MVKFLHTADWQIGETFHFLGERSLYLKDARVGAVQRIAELAADEAVDFVLVAGDVFEFAHPDRISLQRLARAMRTYQGPWLLLPGNHDPAVPHGIWDQLTDASNFSEEVIFMATAVPVFLDGCKTAVLPAPLRARYAGRDLSDDLDRMESPSDYLRIGVAHGAVRGILPEQAEVNNPIAADRVERARLDYLALGDWHGFYRINERTFYSGTPETDRFTQNDSGSVAIVEIAGPGELPVVSQHRTSHFVWHEKVVNIGGPMDLDRLEHELQGFGESDVVKLTIRGYVDLEGLQSLGVLEEDMRARVQVLDWDADGVELAPSDEEIASLALQGVNGLVLERLFERRASLDRGVFRRAVIELLALDEVR